MVILKFLATQDTGDIHVECSKQLTYDIPAYSILIQSSWYELALCTHPPRSCYERLHLILCPTSKGTDVYILSLTLP